MKDNIINNDQMVITENFWGSENPNFDKIVKGDNKLTSEQLEKFEPYHTENCYGNPDAPLKGETYNINANVKGEGTISGNHFAKEGEKAK